MIRGREPRLFRGWQSRAPLWPPAVVLAPSLFLLCSRSNSRKRGGWGGWEEARQSELHGKRGRQQETNPGEATASLGCPLAR